MRFWADLPVAQWVKKRHEPHHKAPWCVIVGGSVRARYTTEAEADALVEKIVAAVEREGTP